MTSRNLEIVVDSPDHIFNAPEINPFSENELDILGISGLAYIMRQLQGRRRDWKNTRLLVRLPRDQIEPEFDRRLTDAIHRYCRAKIADNQVEIHLVRMRNLIGLAILAVIVVALVGGTYLLFADLFTGVSATIQAVIAAAISLFAWVSLWDPLEALLFNPIALARENFILRRIIDLEIDIESAPQTTAANNAQALGASALAASETND